MPKSIVKGLQKKAGRTGMELRPMRPWTNLQLRLTLTGVQNAWGNSDLAKVFRGVCKVFDRDPQVAVGVILSHKDHTDRCEDLVTRRIWRCLTGYKNAYPVGTGMNIRDKLPLSFGDKWILERYSEASKHCKIEELKNYMCRPNDKYLIQDYLLYLDGTDPEKRKEPEGYCPGLLNDPEEKRLIEFLTKLETENVKQEECVKMKRLQLYMQGVGNGPRHS